MTAHQFLQQWWSNTGVRVVTEAVSDARIATLETRYGIELPADFRAYLAHSCPTEENWDEEMGNWWPVARIKNIPEEYSGPLDPMLARVAAKSLFFLDHCIWCWAWAIMCTDDDMRGSVVVIGGSDRIVAPSFSEFVARYVGDWGSVV